MIGAVSLSWNSRTFDEGAKDIRPPSLSAVTYVALWYRTTIMMLLGLVKPIDAYQSYPWGFDPAMTKSQAHPTKKLTPPRE